MTNSDFTARLMIINPLDFHDLLVIYKTLEKIPPQQKDGFLLSLPEYKSRIITKITEFGGEAYLLEVARRREIMVNLNPDLSSLDSTADYYRRVLKKPNSLSNPD